MLMEAYQLQIVDRDYLMHWQAFLNFAVQAKKRIGKSKERPAYSRFDKFFDYEKELQRVSNKKNEKRARFSGIGKLLRKEGT